VHYLQLFFRNRARPILVPVQEEEGREILKYLTDRTEPVTFITVASVEHEVWINGTTLQMAQFLLEMDAPPFTRKEIRPSRQFPKNETEEPDLVDISWHVTFWLQGRPDPVVVSEMHGGDWIEIETSLECDEQFLVITDEDGEELVLRIPDIDMICGLEVDRYSTAQLEAISSLIYLV
jgi:hypothetical protein